VAASLSALSLPEPMSAAPQPGHLARRLAQLVACMLGLIGSLVAGGYWFWQAVRADGGGYS